MALVAYEVDEYSVAHVVLDSPDTRNAMSDAMVAELIAAFERARDDDSARVVVLTSSHDRVFSAGGDIKSFASDRAVLAKYRDLDGFPRLYELIGALGKPVICAANGDVLAGSFGLALACDLVIAREGVRFGCPEINVGLFPFMISALIFRSVDRLKANELMLLGEPIAVEEAKRLNIVNVVVPADRFEMAVDEWARKLSAKSPLALKLGKDAINASRDMTIGQAFAMLQSQLALSFTSEDALEGVAAFREKRAARWGGR